MWVLANTRDISQPPCPACLPSHGHRLGLLSPGQGNEGGRCALVGLKHSPAQPGTELCLTHGAGRANPWIWEQAEAEAFQGSTEPFVPLPELFSPSLSLPLDSWDVNTAPCAGSLLPHICTRGKSFPYRIAIRTGFFRGASSPPVCWLSLSWEWSPMWVNSILLL